MKNTKKLAGISACIAAMLGTMPLGAAAEDETLIYGTMNIPYADFYRAELAGSANEYEVDAVSSATTSKWSKNGEGELCAGTYNQANEDGSGTILGVTYPVALTQETLDALGENNYGFTALDAAPAAYKTVTVADGVVSFSEVQDAEPVALSGVTVTLGTDTGYGDYILTTEGTPEDMGTIYGWILNTESGESYAMRHLENIWRGELAWSTGFVTTENHGNALSYENFTGIMGETITEMVYITENGYYTAATSTYVPVKFEGAAVVADADITAGTTSVTTTGFPADYQMTYTVDGLTASVADGTLTYSDALPGAYTLTVSDASGVYADVLADFTLTTDAMPAVFNGTDALTAAEGAAAADFENYLANIATVSVNGTDYKASGKRSVKIIGADGVIDFAAASGGTNVFDGSGNYTVAITATGYTTPLEFTITAAAETESTTAAETDATTAAQTTTTTAQAAATTAATTKAATGTTSSPKTGADEIAIPAALLTIAGAAALVSRKKRS